VLVFAGILLVICGVVLGNQKLRTDDDYYNCGSAFAPARHVDEGNLSSADLDAEFAKQECPGPISSRQGGVWMMIVLGILASLGGVIAVAIPVPIQGAEIPSESRGEAGAAEAADEGATPSVGLAEELERLAKLHADGLLDSDQFERAKQRALGLDQS
jgi:hypothetical protein